MVEYDPSYNEPIAAVIVGLLLSVSAGFRVMLPLLVVNLLAVYHQIHLPENMQWLNSHMTTVLLGVGCVAETTVHFIPVAGTYLKAAATPLAFVAGTLLMAVPLGDHNPLYQWTMAGAIGGGAAMLTHLGVTGARAISAPANLATVGVFGIAWNIFEAVISTVLALIGWFCLFAGWVAGAIVLIVLLAAALVIAVAGWRRLTGRRALAS